MWIKNNLKTGNTISIMDKNTLNEVKSFHESFSEYEPTPLVSLERLAEKFCISKLYVKDESHRFGLNSFKVLGGTFAIGKYLAQKLGKNIAETPFSEFKNPEVRKQIGDIIFATATDGNHGRGVAWMARQLGYQAKVYMPEGTTKNRLEHILEENAEASITDFNYDDAVRYVAEQARINGWEVIQDTAWEGYEDVPTWIMQGYSTLVQEIVEQLEDEKPTHVFLQAGVGAFAAVMANGFSQAYADNPPKIIIVEPDKADCFYRSAASGKITPVTGNMHTIMAGLACGEPNPVAWSILRETADFFVTTTDSISARGMRILGNPLKGDPAVVSGESGAVTAGMLSIIAMDSEYEDLKKAIGLDNKSKVVLVSTEGDTDPQMYRKIVWDGEFQSI